MPGKTDCILLSSPLIVREDYSIHFSHEGEFAALGAARAWLGARGFSYGSLQAHQPIGILHGDYKIAKWRNLDAEERADLHGIITARLFGYRQGPVTVTIRKDAPTSVLEAFRSDPEAEPGSGPASLLHPVDHAAMIHVEGHDPRSPGAFAQTLMVDP